MVFVTYYLLLLGKTAVRSELRYFSSLLNFPSRIYYLEWLPYFSPALFSPCCIVHQSKNKLLVLESWNYYRLHSLLLIPGLNKTMYFCSYFVQRYSHSLLCLFAKVMVNFWFWNLGITSGYTA